MAITATSFLFAIIGLWLGGGGAWLLSLGGSPFYLVAGIAFLAIAWLLERRSTLALWAYAMLVLATLGWAVWEAGFDWWQLGTRGGIVVLLGLWLLLPPVRHALARRAEDASPRQANSGTAFSALALAGVLVVSMAVAGYSLMVDPYNINGRFAPAPQAGVDAKLGPDDMSSGEWHHYGRTLYGQRYSPLNQINTQTVDTLEVAWTYQTGDTRRPSDVTETTYQVTPLKVGDRLYICTPHNIAIAIDAMTGEEIWRFDPKVPANPDRQHQTCRGVTYFDGAASASGASETAAAGGVDVGTAAAASTPPTSPAAVSPTVPSPSVPSVNGPCVTRVYLPTSDARLIALDAETGAVCPSFGDNGTLHLEAGMPHHPEGYYYSTSPPTAVAGRIIVGGAVNDNYSTREQSGVIRAFDALDGTLLWNWDSGNPEETDPLAPGETYTTNSPNSWSVFSADPDLGLVYIPLGNQVPDQLGMNRSASVEKYSSSIVALDIDTGQVRWVRQTVHHDLWDMDVPAQPVLVNLTGKEGGEVLALVGATKQGDIYVLDRRTGEPILPVTEVPAPQGTIPEDHAAPTQPVSALSFMPPRLRERDMWGLTLFDQLACRISFKSLRYEGRYTPPSVEGTLVYPGNFGTFNWGSVAVDPVRQVMFGMPTYLAFTSRLVPRSEIPPKGANEKASEQGLNRNDGAPYGVVMGPFLSPLGIPCQTPPWGYVAGADLKTGEIVYKHRNGTVRDMTPLPLPFKVGVPGIGGPMLTGGGLAFLGAAVDDYFRAYDETSGEVLWSARLPAGGQSTPMTYEASDGNQYVVIVAGGHGSIGTTPGDYVIAYRLPDSRD